MIEGIQNRIKNCAGLHFVYPYNSTPYKVFVAILAIIPKLGILEYILRRKPAYPHIHTFGGLLLQDSRWHDAIQCYHDPDVCPFTVLDRFLKRSMSHTLFRTAPLSHSPRTLGSKSKQYPLYGAFLNTYFQNIRTQRFTAVLCTHHTFVGATSSSSPRASRLAQPMVCFRG